MSKHTNKRIATAEVTNMINAITKDHGVELTIETTIDKSFSVRAWRKENGNRAIAAFSCRKCIGDALGEVEKELRK